MKWVKWGNYKESDIIEDINGGGYVATQDFVLHIDEHAIALGRFSVDTITIGS